MVRMMFQAADAKNAVTKVDEELAKLQATLDNIQQARPFEDLTVRDIDSDASRRLFRDVNIA